tara:strand:- start:502 stop:918 length:417 start_codon:yes stop_codon:yes gene_type:complete
MKETELRIGNLVQLDPSRNWYPKKDIHIIEVENILLDGVNDEGEYNFTGVGYESIQPIPLTEEWAQKFKCEIVDGDVNDEWGGMKEYIFNDFYELSFFNSQVYLHCFNMCEEVEYVHQLQNLYFALTGKELVINETIK